VFAVTAAEGSPPLPIFNDAESTTEAEDQLSALGSGAVATVAVLYERPMSVAEAQSISDDPGADVRVVWSGFDASLGMETPPDWTWLGTLGYGTCLHQEPLDEELLSATSAGFSRDAMFASASVPRALDSVISGLENIESRPEFVDYVTRPFGDDPESVSAVLDQLRNEPQVVLLVVTGPAPEAARFVSAAQADASATVLAVDFYNWDESICGGMTE
jgi:hypothetical protein